MTGGPIDPWSPPSTVRERLYDLIGGEFGGFIALGATVSPVGVLRTCHGWLVGTGVDPTGAAALVVAAAVLRWAVGVSLFATRAVEW